MKWFLRLLGLVTKAEYEEVLNELLESQMNDSPRDLKTGRFIKRKFGGNE